MRETRSHNWEEDEPESPESPKSRDQKGFVYVKLIMGIIVNSTILSVLLFIRFYHPQKPKFLLQDATIFTFNLSTTPPNFLNSTLQITIVSKNPNDNSGIYYEDLNIYAEYMNQQITYQTAIPRVYQGHKETNVWSLMINATDILIAPYSVPVLAMDQSKGFITLTIKVHGHVRWKIGSYTTRKYHIHVLCNPIIYFGVPDINGVFDFSHLINVKYFLYRGCRVSV